MEDAENNAFSAGTDNRKRYVAKGPGDEPGQFHSTISILSEPSFYYTEGTNSKKIPVGPKVQYLAKDQEDCELHWVDSQYGQDAPYSVHVTIDGEKFLFGKTIEGSFYLHIGKVGTVAPNKKMFFPLYSRMGEVISGYQVLVCTPKSESKSSTFQPRYVEQFFSLIQLSL